MNFIKRWFLGLRIQYLRNQLKDLAADCAASDLARDRMNADWHRLQAEVLANQARLEALEGT